MLTTESLRNLLSTTDVTKDPYGIAAGATTLIGNVETREEGAQHYVRALQALRLTAAAGRLTHQAATTGLIPWTSRARRFAANIKALEWHVPAAAALVAEAGKDLSAYELHQAADGNYQVLDTRLPVINGWVGGLANHKATALAWQFDRSKPSLPLPVAFDGVAFGWPLLRVLETTANSYLTYSCAVYVLESEPLLVAMLFHMHDLQEILRGRRTKWFVGTDPSAMLEEFHQALLAHRGWSLPGQFVRCQVKARPKLDLERITLEVRKTRETSQIESLTSTDAHYAAISPEHWRARFAAARSGGEPLRVLGITSRYTTVLQHSMAEMKAAAETAGARFDIAMEPDDHSVENPFIEKIATEKPDLIVQISRMRYENPNLPKGVPFLCWDQDNLPCMRAPEATASLNPLTYVAGHGAIFGYTNLHWPRQNCIFVHAAAATHRYHAASTPADLLAKHACDVSYVSNASGTPETLAQQLRSRYQANSDLAAFFDELLADLLAQSGQGVTWETVALRNMVRTRAKQKGLPLDTQVLTEIMMDVTTFTDRAFRQTALAWVSRWCESNGKTLRLYGNGWESHPTLARWAAGSVTPGEEARAVFQASKINLQLIQPGFSHSRALDGLAAGGFFLTRYTQADGVGSTDIAALYKLATWVAKNAIETDTQLDAVDDPDIRNLTATVRAYYLKNEVVEPLCPSLHIWARTPAAAILFPQLDRIVFRNETEFAAQATKFLADDSLRENLAAEMRSVVEKQFSYRARWDAFTAAIEAGLARKGV